LLDFVASARSLGVHNPDRERQIAIRCAPLDPEAAAALFIQPLSNGEPNKFEGLRALSEQWIANDRIRFEEWAQAQEGTAHFSVLAEELLKAARQRGDIAAEQRWRNAIASQKTAN
jgi:hypothetical protein